LDRNECNILVKEKKTKDDEGAEFELVPIDHGMAFPDNLSVCSFDLYWLSCSQAEQPFSRESLEFIRDIDVMADIKLLESKFKFRPECLRNIRISTTLLKKGAAAGLTLAQIG